VLVSINSEKFVSINLDKFVSINSEKFVSIIIYISLEIHFESQQQST
jgi:hypothetical protein